MGDPTDRFRLWLCSECGYQSIEGVPGGVVPWPDGKARCPSRKCQYHGTVMECEGTLTRHLMDLQIAAGRSDEDALKWAAELEQARSDGYADGLQRHGPRLRALLYRWLDVGAAMGVGERSQLSQQTLAELADNASLHGTRSCERCGGTGFLVDPHASPFADPSSGQ
jgi:hypothetical protein